ncbi:unnamed protein product, partial [Didymodactylos carnosus]
MLLVVLVLQINVIPESG